MSDLTKDEAIIELSEMRTDAWIDERQRMSIEMAINTIKAIEDIKAEIQAIDSMTFVGNGSGCASEMKSECLKIINKYIGKENV